MTSTLPALQAQRLPSGTVEVYDGARLVRRYLEWHTDRPNRESRTIQINNKHFRLTWHTTP